MSSDFLYVKELDQYVNKRYIHSMKHHYESDGNPCFQLKVVDANIRFGHSYARTFQVCKKDNAASYHQIVSNFIGYDLKGSDNLISPHS
jgi:hypothetical protein